MLNRILTLFALLFLTATTGGCGRAMVGGADAAMPAGTMAYSAEEAAFDDEGMPEMAPSPVAAPQAMKRQAGGGGRLHGQLAQGPAAPPPPDAAPDTAQPDAPPSPPESQPDARLAGPLLIYTAEIGMSVFETAKALDAVEALARKAGGYLVVRNDTTITVRVPAGQFDTALAGVMKLGDVLERNVEVRDVTEEYYDLQTRLRNKEAVLERLKELLKRAENVEDALKVETELARVAADVEQMKGRLKLLRELVSFSTITVRFAPQQVEHIDGTVELPFPWLGGLGLGNLMSL